MAQASGEEEVSWEDKELSPGNSGAKLLNPVLGNVSKQKHSLLEGQKEGSQPVKEKMDK